MNTHERTKPLIPRESQRPTEQEKIVHIGLSELHPFKNHSSSIREDATIEGKIALNPNQVSMIPHKMVKVVTLM